MMCYSDRIYTIDDFYEDFEKQNVCIYCGAFTDIDKVMSSLEAAGYIIGANTRAGGEALSNFYPFIGYYDEYDDLNFNVTAWGYSDLFDNTCITGSEYLELVDRPWQEAALDTSDLDLSTIF